MTLPAIQSASDVVAAVGAVADAVGAGDITPDEGQAVASILEAKRKAIETVDLERASRRWNRSGNDDRLFEQAPFEIERRCVANGERSPIRLIWRGARQKAREDEWQAAGSTGRMPREPLEPPPPATARRYDRELWRKIAHGERPRTLPA